jgi:hypothetical protein
MIDNKGLATDGNIIIITKSSDLRQYDFKILFILEISLVKDWAT